MKRSEFRSTALMLATSQLNILNLAILYPNHPLGKLEISTLDSDRDIGNYAVLKACPGYIARTIYAGVVSLRADMLQGGTVETITLT
jgi:hypothetical protein